MNEQENFWSGDFGNNYIARNIDPELLASNVHFFSKALEKADGIKSMIEFGANVGMNLRAILQLFPDTDISAIEINESAAKQLEELLDSSNIFNSSINEFNSEKLYDLVLIKGVLIHCNPEDLSSIYSKLYNCSSKYILIAEYYNPTPVSLSYRGHENKLFKRDFAGEMLDAFKDLELIDYGFSYHRGPFPQDDITWFLLKK